MSVVDSVAVTGAGDLDAGDLLEGSGLEEGVSLIEITQAEVQAAILSNLTRMGYLEAVVLVEWPEWYEDEGIVRITVESGSRSLLGALVFSGNTVLDAPRLRRLIPYRPGAVLTPQVLDRMVSIVLETYSRRGYVLAEVAATPLPPGPPAPDGSPDQRAVEISISEGRQIRLGTVSVSGLETVREKVVTREISLQQGDSLDMELMRRSISSIYSLGLFRDVRFVYQGMAEGLDQVDLLVQVTERPYRQLDLGAGYASPSALVTSAYWKHPNIWGNNQRLTAGASWTRYLSSGGGDVVEPELIYEEPYLYSTRWEGRLRLSYFFLELPGLSERRYSGETSLSRMIGPDLELTLGYKLTRNRYSLEQSGGGSGTYSWDTSSEIGAGLVNDTRDAVLNPVRGSYLQAGGAVSGGILGGRSFYRIEGEARVFKPVVRDVNLAWRVRGGVVLPYGADSVIAPGDRYFLGGGSTVRGYAFNTLGPKDDEGNPVGGRIMLLGNIEARMRVAGNLGMALFVDTGGLWEEFDEISPGSAGFGIGMGVRYSTPFGPLRLDYGFAPTWTDGLRRGRAYLALGHPF